MKIGAVDLPLDVGDELLVNLKIVNLNRKSSSETHVPTGNDDEAYQKRLCSFPKSWNKSLLGHGDCCECCAPPFDDDEASAVTRCWCEGSDSI